MKLHLSIKFVFCFFIFSFGYSQFTLNTELRPRSEYRHGYKTLFPDNEDAALFVSQRTRLNADYKLDGLSFYLSLQDIRVWGDVPQLNNSDKNGIGIHQAWGEIALNNDLSLKVGRQEISYDDHRIFGNVGWAQQARSHDALLLKYQNSNFNMHLGLAYNQDSEDLTGTTLTTPGTYKSIQYLWGNKTWKKLSASILFLNNGMQFIDLINSNDNKTRYSQTLGTHLKHQDEGWMLSSNLFYQMGKDVSNNSLNAFLISLEANYKVTNKWQIGLGGELLSGNNNGIPENGKNKAFNPFYGTNHKFNGHMDYFYVGNHINNVGLIDIYLKTKLVFSEKDNLSIAFHNFSAEAPLSGTGKKQLGNELDLTYNYKIQKYVSLAAGYAHLFPSEGMKSLKGNYDENTNNWGWVMLTINPTLFTTNN
ncbi:alginate export family protein [Arenibacter latericius]|uniref:alginate export family protein n=1 Tax=Arenibacter latericius TaxID=86104 RepID=UPI00040FCB1C|nr:alginate export family protein [Arenibacter latericius]